MKNSVRSRAKFSKLETATNTYIIVIVCVQIILSFIAGLLNTIWEYVNYDDLVYLRAEDTTATNTFITFIINFGTWFLAISNLVPISLMVTLECVKFI